MNLKEKLGQNIKKYRKLNNVTQEKLAEIVDMEINSISSIERGIYMPAPENLVKLASALNVKISYLFNFDDELSCDDCKSEIISNLDLLKNDKAKLNIVNTFVKTMLTVGLN